LRGFDAAGREVAWRVVMTQASPPVQAGQRQRPIDADARRGVACRQSLEVHTDGIVRAVDAHAVESQADCDRYAILGFTPTRFAAAIRQGSKLPDIMAVMLNSRHGPLGCP
jgi:hypothetical protein